MEWTMVHNYPPPSAISLISKWLLGGFSILYFLCVLIQLKLITPWLLKHITCENYKLTRDPIWLITPLYLIVFSLIRLYADISFEQVNEFVPFDHFFPSWLVYYYLGMACKFRDIKIRPIYTFIALIVSYYISIVVAFWLNGHSSLHNFPYTQSKLTSMFIAISVILLVYSLRDMNMKRNILARIGEFSFGIYLIHMPVMIVTQKVISVLHIQSIIDFYNIAFIKYLSVLFASVVIVAIFNKVLPKKTVRVLGLQ